jgi:hypothetical protein
MVRLRECGQSNGEATNVWFCHVRNGKGTTESGRLGGGSFANEQSNDRHGGLVLLDGGGGLRDCSRASIRE